MSDRPLSFSPLAGSAGSPRLGDPNSWVKNAPTPMFLGATLAAQPNARAVFDGHESADRFPRLNCRLAQPRGEAVMSDNKSKDSGPGLLTTVAVGVVVLGGYHYYRERQKPKPLQPIDVKSLPADYPVKSARIPALQRVDSPQDPAGRCLDALGGNCIDRPCPIVQAIAIVAKKGLQPADAEDVAHDTMVEVCLNAIDGETSKSWTQALIRRVQFRRIDYLRRSAKVCAYEGNLDRRRALNALGDGETDDGELKAAICDLSKIDKCVVTARYWDDLDDSSIASKCGMTSTAMVRKQLERARGKLKKALTGAPARANLPRGAALWPRDGRAPTADFPSSLGTLPESNAQPTSYNDDDD